MIRNITDLAKNAHILVLWMDCDMEGEALANDIMNICLEQNKTLKTFRAIFSAVTKNDI